MEQSDIVERLKACANGVGSLKTERGDFGLCEEAAAEIMKLRRQNARAADAILGQFLAALPLDRIVTSGGSVGALIDGIRQVVRERDGATAEITRLRAALAEKMVVKVKPLFWQHDASFCGQDCSYSDTAFGAWMLTQYEARGNAWAHTDPCGEDTYEDWPTRDEAQTAAQADYERRILTAVEAVPASQIRAEALREAAALVDAGTFRTNEKGDFCGHDIEQHEYCDECLSKQILALTDAPKGDK